MYLTFLEIRFIFIKTKLVIIFHFTDDRRELSYAETLEMIENHGYLTECFNDSVAHVVGVRLLMILFHSREISSAL